MQNTSIKKISALGFPWQTQDPFLFCAFHHDLYPKGNGKKGPDESLAGRNIGQDFNPSQKWRMYHGTEVPGFPYHPHRGFETITIVPKGMVDHADSLGAAGRFGNGDVQWMTAGKGVQHSEMFPLLNDEEENPLTLFQIWLNLPKASKLVEPHFKMLWAENIPHIKEQDETGKNIQIDLISGNYKDAKSLDSAPDSWAADPAHELAVWLIKIEAGGTWKMPRSKQNINRSLYFYQGDTLTIDEKSIDNNRVVEFISTADVEITAGSEDAYLLMLQGKPIQEPVAQYGPFVMNTQQEIQEAFQEYQKTEFGGWPWPQKETVHGDEGRFALYADGKKEFPQTN